MNICGTFLHIFANTVSNLKLSTLQIPNFFYHCYYVFFITCCCSPLWSTFGSAREALSALSLKTAGLILLPSVTQ